jgi:hypothetical protein
MATLFNDPAVKFNVLSGQINQYRAVFELKAGIPASKIKRGLWLKLGAGEKLEDISSGTGSRNCFVVLQPGTESDVVAFPFDLQGNERGGQIAVVTGDYMAEVGENGWKSSLGIAAFAVDTPLKVNSNGQLEPAVSGDVVSAYSLGVRASNMLVFTTHGANVTAA